MKNSQLDDLTKDPTKKAQPEGNKSMGSQFIDRVKSYWTKIVALAKRRWRLSIVLLIILGGLGIWFYRRQHSQQPQLQFISPQREVLAKTLEVSGIVDAKEKAMMRFAAGGKVVYLGAKEGEWVKKWQTIATIDQRELQNRLEKDLNLYMKERYDWEQQLADIEGRSVLDEERRTVNKNQLDLTNTVLDVEVRDIAITNTVLSAPFAGILVASPVDTNGVHVLATEGWEIVNPDSLVFRAEVDEEDIGSIEASQTGRLTLDAYPDETVETQVSYIAYKSDETTSGTIFIVEFPLTGSLEKYRLGMNGDIEIVLEEKPDVLTLPLIAIKEREGKTFVDVKTNDHEYQEREIQLGLETDEKVEVLSGLQPDEMVLLPE